MNDARYYLAIDLGATSGRAILGTLADGHLKTEELARFSNKMISIDNYLHWDLDSLFSEILHALKTAADREIPLSSIGVDAWGVDVALFDRRGKLLEQPYAYRDARTTETPEEFFSEMSREELYALTGIQFMHFNTLFQLYELRQRRARTLESAYRVLFIPDAISYLLTGEMVTEYTIASTSQMLDPHTRQFSPKLLEMVGVSGRFPRITMPGKRVGKLSESVQQRTGLGAVPVVAVAGHDTASAVAALPAVDKSIAYISSGTWSLMGVESPKPVITEESYRLNFTNEGGADGGIRLLKNICGLWLLERCRDEWDDPALTHEAIVEAARASRPFRSLINPDSPRFANPPSMTTAIRSYCAESGQPTPETPGEFARCIMESLALRYRQVFDMLRVLTSRSLRALHVIGGGSKNDLLNSFTASALNIPVTAGPAEATAVGNILMQSIADGATTSISAARRLARASSKLTRHAPQQREQWEEMNRQFRVYNNKV